MWSTNDNSVDRQTDTKYESISRPDYIETNGIYKLEQKQIHEAMTQDTPVKTTSNSTYNGNIIAYNKEVQRISKVVHS